MPLNILQRHKNVHSDSEPSATPKRSSALWPAVFLALGAALLLWIYEGHMVASLIRPDAMDYAQLGRNLLNGHGLTTYILRPLALTHGSNAMAQPDVTHGPLYPFLLALAFGLFGVKDPVVQAVSGLCFVLTVPMLVFLGQRLFSRSVGLLAALVFLFNPAMLQYAAEAGTVPLFVFLATCLFLALDRVASRAHTVGAEGAGRPAQAPLVLTGLLAGLLYLTEPLFFWLLPIVVAAVVCWHPRYRVRVAFSVLVPLSLLILPSMARFGMLTGNPLFGLRGAELWMNTTASPGFAGYRMAPEEFSRGSGHLLSVLLKSFLATNAGLGALQRLPALCILLFVVPGLFFRYGDRGVNKVRAVLLLCLLGVFAGSIGLTFDPTLLMVVFPILLLYALAYLTHLAQEARLNSLSLGLASTGIGAVLLFPLIASLVTTRRPIGTPEAEVARAMQKQSRPGEVSFSDQPWIAAWYADRPSIWIPVDDTNITAMRTRFKTVRWLFLTPEARSLSQEWNIAFNGFMQWDRQYRHAMATGAPPPPELVITKGAVPISEALDGFVVRPLIESDTPSAVVAEAPASGALVKREEGLTEQIVGK